MGPTPQWAIWREGTPYLPNDAWTRAQVHRRMYFEEDYVQNGLASLRHWTLTGKLVRRSSEMIAAKQATSASALAILERWLARVRTQPGFLDVVYPYSLDPRSGAELP